MSLTSGSRIGPYEISGLLGVGGMGEVYRARDTKLNREVALKVLPEAFAEDPERMARFQREAQILAALNHPNIAQIYGAEGAALVMEFVPGETLRGPLPLEEALAIARQIAEGLEAAHEKGIIHRDLKPTNIKVTPDGKVKVLDFGLAKSWTGARAGGSSSTDLSQSPTLAHAVTEPGRILGTAAYMSPEQTRGMEVDRRTDIWAFGCVLYELLAGRAAFAADTGSDTIAAILGRDPDWNVLPLTTPASVKQLLRRCLEKDTKRRLRDIGDAGLDLEESSMAGADVAVPASPRCVHFQRLTDFTGLNESPAISPDGKMVAYVALTGGKRHIWIRMLAGGTPLQVTRDDLDHDQPRWVPDSSAVIYYTPPTKADEQGTLWEISALGGPPRPVVSALGGGDVSRDGRIAFFQFHRGRSTLVTIARDGSELARVTPAPDGHACASPRWSHDGRWLAFHGAVLSRFDERAYVIAVTGGEARIVTRASSLRGLSWLPDSAHLVCSSSVGSTVPYPPTCNLRAVDIGGTGDRQLTFGDMSYVEPDVHQSGKLLVCRIRSESDIWKIPVSGSPEENTRNAVRITRQSGQVQTPSVSPDGREVVYLSDNGGHGNLWIASTVSGNVRQLTFEQDPAFSVGVPLWSPAGQQIAFVMSRGHIGLWSINPDGRGLRLLVAPGFGACWSPDGDWLYYSPAREFLEWCISKIPAAGGESVPVRHDHNSHAPAAGRSAFYFASRLKPELGGCDWEIRRALSEDGPSDALVSVSGSRLPVSPLFAGGANLSPDGRHLALPLMDGATTNLWAIPTGGGSIRPLTDFGDRPTTIARQVSWSPDNQHIYSAVAEISADVILLDGLL